jgi:hypothetical protein
MTSLFTARRRAEEFADAVDSRTPLAGVRDAEADQLLALVRELQAQPTVEPRPEFRTDLRERLMTEARTSLHRDNAALTLPARPRGSRERRLAAAASVLVLVGGTAGMAAAAQDALPGQALYPVKRGIEQAQAQLRLDDASRGRELLQQASGRLGEVDGLISDDPARANPQVARTLTDFAEQADQGGRLLLTSFARDRDPASVEALRDFTADRVRVLSTLATRVAPASGDELAAAAQAIRALDEDAVAACPGCSSRPVVQIPGLIQARSEVERALAEAGNGASGLNNDHPVVVPQGTVDRPGTRSDKRADERSDSRSDHGSTGSRGSDGPGGTSGLELPDLGVPQKSPGSDSDGPLSQLGDLTGDLTGGLTDGLTGGKGAGNGGDKAGSGTSDGTAGTKQDQKSGGNGGADSEKSGGPLGDVTGGLDGAVETLLPDSDLGDLLD